MSFISEYAAYIFYQHISYYSSWNSLQQWLIPLVRNCLKLSSTPSFTCSNISDATYFMQSASRHFLWKSSMQSHDPYFICPVVYITKFCPEPKLNQHVNSQSFPVCRYNSGHVHSNFKVWCWEVIQLGTSAMAGHTPLWPSKLKQQTQHYETAGCWDGLQGLFQRDYSCNPWVSIMLTE